MNFERYMKLDVEAYYEDTSLFSTISFNGKELIKDASEKRGWRYCRHVGDSSRNSHARRAIAENFRSLSSKKIIRTWFLTA